MDPHGSLDFITQRDLARLHAYPCSFPFALGQPVLEKSPICPFATCNLLQLAEALA